MFTKQWKMNTSLCVDPSFEFAKKNQTRNWDVNINMESPILFCWVRPIE